MSGRRDFFRQAVAVTAGLATGEASAQQRRAAMPTARASALMKSFALKYPIFCAGMGPTATPELESKK